MLKSICIGAFAASVALSTGFALADDRSDELHDQTAHRRRQTGAEGRATGRAATNAANGAGHAVAETARAGVNETRAVAHRVTHGDDAHARHLSNRAEAHTHHAGVAARGAGRATGRTAVHGVNTAGRGTQTAVDATQAAGHDATTSTP